MTSAAFIVGYLCGLVLLCIFALIAISLRLAYTKMDVMLEHLKNSSSVMSLAALRHGGPWGKLLLVGGISGFVTFSGFYLKHGGVDAEDLKNFPVSLKRKLTILQWSAIGLLGALAFFVALYKVIVAYHI
ncbi:hypothetical protein [Pseudomonas sp. MWU13-2100]|uniref:hypothetical protein n=1 Tax=Pseudomonas sp. MWU13-2100 TaxID=2935075 RepID=UPI00200C82DF|nr:hypothetical protein [Pseudomonas sp. MWU13-2100]